MNKPVRLASISNVFMLKTPIKKAAGDADEKLDREVRTGRSACTAGRTSSWPWRGSPRA